jgi:hypothetical protein
MKYIYISDTNGTVWGSFDSLEDAKRFGATLVGGYKVITNLSGGF